MGLQMHVQRTMHRLRGAATTAVRGIDAVRPAYDATKPVLHKLGISTAVADKALSHYDGIRRALGH
jgi:hypothetical protein